jgi:hypothetical protein
MDTVLFSFRKETLQPTKLLPEKTELFQKLEERGVQPFITLGAEGAFDDSGVEVHQLDSENTTRHFGVVGLDQVGLIANRVDRSFKNDLLPSTLLDSDVPVMNNNAMRSLAFRKNKVHTELYQPLEMGIDTQLVESIDQIAAFMEVSPSKEYIVKPNSGTFSKGVHRLSADEVLPFFINNPEAMGVTLLQPAIDFSVPLPETIRPYDAASAEDFKTWSKADVTKEFRMYGFHANGETEAFPVARAMKDGVDNWFFVDPDSVPEQLYTDTKKLLSRAAQLTGSKAIYAARDIGFGSLNGEAPDYYDIELNGRMPYLIGAEKHTGVANTLRDLHADQIAKVVKSKDIE